MKGFPGLRMMTVKEAVIQARSRLEEAGIESPRCNAEMLLGNVLGKKRFEFYLRDEEISIGDYDSFVSLVEKRSMHTPVAYITGDTEFMSLAFAVNTSVFIPRPDTEVLVETVLGRMGEGSRIVDMCTGCGNVAVSLAKYSSCHIYACDILREAVLIARKNAIMNEVLQSISFFQGDMFAPLGTEGCFDLVVSNPPYVRHREIRTLPGEVRDFEPHVALDGGEDGLRFFRSLCIGSQNVLKMGGYLMVEVGFDQAGEVCRLFERTFKSVEVVKDYAGVERVVVGQK